MISLTVYFAMYLGIGMESVALPCECFPYFPNKYKQMHLDFSLVYQVDDQLAVEMMRFPPIDFSFGDSISRSLKKCDFFVALAKKEGRIVVFLSWKHGHGWKESYVIHSKKTHLNKEPCSHLE